MDDIGTGSGPHTEEPGFESVLAPVLHGELELLDVAVWMAAQYMETGDELMFA